MTDFITAFFIGLMASSHCIAMCGGISMAIGAQQKISDIAFYNLGRITSYTLMGLIVGLLGLLFTELLQSGLALLRMFAGALLILMGLYISRWYLGISHFEKLFVPVWRLIQPAASKALSSKSPTGKLCAGFLWGWLPCGLIYSNLAWASTQAEPINAMLVMLFFALGTLPSMFTTGLLFNQAKDLFKYEYFKIVSGSLIIIYGFYSIYLGYLQL
ncbi:sulfite exporter TauE/SafE family protein [Catenovulum sp. SM1970]|uniref:sulfite exporter TauE/SafE family protein n=1 Tax=Marinifaba aquimaris TaxID=2741323 RepID=UPI001573AEE6|nr:sulfite exporter TauE/SafE family protein [Marinifaba aquimaris]NTS77303.1 sulfite exporter TauE/SafE family protein [Marinifaba aquimaris]